MRYTFEKKNVFLPTKFYEKSHSKLSKSETCMYMLGRLLCQIRAGGRGERGGSLHEGGENCLKYLRKEWNRNEGVQDFKIGGKLH